MTLCINKGVFIPIYHTHTHIYKYLGQDAPWNFSLPGEGGTTASKATEASAHTQCLLTDQF